MTTDAETSNYVECVKCGHPLERHSVVGCDYQKEGCPCDARWGRSDIERLRRLAGLPSRYKSTEF